jgi:hypothetical protein
MLLMSVLLASTIAQPIAHGRHCTASAVRSVVRDDDSAAPIILSVRNGSRYRLMGTDFIHADRDWKAGEKLRLCVALRDQTTAITNINRKENVVALRPGAR